MPSSISLYLHIPFCAVRCPYCDFNTYAGLENLYGTYAGALSAEIVRAGDTRGHPAVRTIFVGGGTPTVLPEALMAQVFDAIHRSFAVLPDAEITSEANPGTADLARFAALRALGVNRLSMGVQSFDDAELRWLGRIHGADEAETAYHAARQAGFDNINLDFMFGLPHQEPEIWRRTLARATALAPEHLSLYSLTVEHGTPLADQVSRGVVSEPDDDLAAELYLTAWEHLGAAGYRHYEISNWARGEACRHNLVYWRHEPYLGFGAGAHSFAEHRRWWNVRPVADYIRRVQSGGSPEREGEEISARLAMGELMMLGLRLIDEGVDEERFSERFGQSLDEAFGDTLRALIARGLLERLHDRVRLTAQGRLLGNQVFMEFLPE